MDILTLNFRKNYYGRTFQNFFANQRYPLPKLVKFRPTLCNFVPGPYCAKKFTQVLSYVVCTQVRRHVHKQITKKKIRRRKGRKFCFRKTSFVYSRYGTYYALLIGYFSLIFLPDARHCVCWVLAELWARDLSHKIGNQFLFITVRLKERFVCVRN